MNFLAGKKSVRLPAFSLLCLAGFTLSGQTTPKSAVIESGQSLFLANCAFCHGRDASGGETGPDLTGSKLVASDVHGDKIGPVILNGRQDKGMPRFSLPQGDIDALVAFIHHEKTEAASRQGGRRKVDVSDLQTGDAAAGKAYFQGNGKCATCHSATGDLADIGKRFEGLRLEMRMLYPEKAESKVKVTTPSGETLAGTLAYRDEFTIGLRDAEGWYHSWPVSAVKFEIDSPVEAHAELLGKYTDADIHNLMAYLQTLR